MTTLRETIHANIAAAESDLAAKKEKLAEMESSFVAVLDRDVEEVKTLWRTLAVHLFQHAAATPPAAPSA